MVLGFNSEYNKAVQLILCDMQITYGEVHYSRVRRRTDSQQIPHSAC